MLDHPRDRRESQLAVEERGHRDLIGGVEHRRRRAAFAQRRIREPDAGEALWIRPLERQRSERREVQRRRLDHFTVGLVGYTNAGKSTLFNTLTAGGAYADDRLFATLMTRTREWDVGGGHRVMLSDTVGFVRDLPHNLVASFKATLEEATHADVLLIVLDIADPAAERSPRKEIGRSSSPSRTNTRQLW